MLALLHVNAATFISVGEGQSKAEAIDNALLRATIGSGNPKTNTKRKVRTKNYKIINIKQKNGIFTAMLQVEGQKPKETDQTKIIAYADTAIKTSTKKQIQKPQTSAVAKPTPQEAPKPSTKKLDKTESLAILTPKIRTPHYIIKGRKISSYLLTNLLPQSLNNELSSIQKYKLVDRQNIKAQKKEAALMQNSQTNQKPSSPTSADLLLITTVEHFGSPAQKSHAAIPKFHTSGYNIDAVITYRLLAVGTNEIKTSNTLNLHLNNIMAASEQEAIQKASEQIAAIIKIELTDGKITLQNEPNSNEKTDQDTITDENGGVRLPFD